MSSQSLLKIISDRINTSCERRITFADYMNLVLYQPQSGYYSSGQVKIGSQGDFFTSSSLGADFGELLAEQFLEMWEILGYPTPFNLGEMGAGAGLLANDILQYLQQHYLEFFNHLEYTIVEQAEGLIQEQQKLLQQWLDKSTKLFGNRGQKFLNHSIVGCAFSNELVDALPVHQVITQAGKLREIYVTIDKNNLTETIANLSTPKLAQYFDLIEINLLAKDYPENYRTEVNLSALDWLETVAKKLKRGYLLTIDYGYHAQRYYNPQRYQGTLQCYYQHRYHNNPYINLGTQDITAHVNFTTLERQGQLSGLETHGFTQQGLFLMALGLSDRLAALSSGQFNLHEILQRRDALHQLINPAGLGGFGVLIQSKGLTEQEKGRLLKGLKN